MIVVVDERELVKDGYTSLFGREGVPSTGFDPNEFGEWVNTAAETDINAVEAFLIGQGNGTLARAAAIRRRFGAADNFTDIGAIRVFSDGRDPEIEGENFPLPRRERRILEYLVANRGRRVSKTQIFSAIYGIFDEDVEENVIESHISKLRKKLRKKLGFDPIDSKRFLGYCIDWK
ncbi:MAG: winged helix-turn-helix domain-containing protein [Gammaproteobacteria bacterium]